MKKTLLIILLSVIPLIGNTQSILITSVIEGACGTTDQEAPRIIELYVDGTVNTSNYQIEVQIGTSWLLPSVFSGSFTDEFLYIASDATVLNTEFPSIPATNKLISNTSTFADGMRAVRIIDTANSNAVIDIYGVDGQAGTGQAWEYTNSYAKRNNGTSASATFNASDWTINAIDSLVNIGICNNGGAMLNNTIQIGTYNPSANLTDRDALIALYNATDGANWTNPWDLSASESTWSGVNLDAISGRVTGLFINNRGLNGTLPSEIGALSEMTFIFISDSSNLTGSIPNEIGDLTKLTSLNIRNCSIDSIPSSIVNLTNLTTLSLRGNAINTFPLQVLSLTGLNSLFLDGNSISGTIPSNIGDLTALTSLNLRSNNLTGTIPTSIGDLQNLKSLNLSSNNLSGGIPSELWTLIKLEFLTLSVNSNLNTLLPATLGNLIKLKDLDLSQSGLSGTIPTEIGQLTDLTNLTLDSNNNLTGSLPATFGNLTALEVINLQATSLSGELPSGMSNFTNLITFLTGSGTSFSGSFPDFTNATNLNSLSFWNNSFVFDDFESEFIYYNMNVSFFGYAPQNKVDNSETFSITEGNDITLSVDATTSINNTYQWRKNGTDITGATNRQYTITNATLSDSGSYDCVINNNIVTGLTLTRNTITLGVTLSNNDFALAGINVYPNPTKDVLNISLGEHINIKATLKNMIGQEILSQNYLLNNSMIDLSKIPNGIYILTLTDSNTRSYSQRIIKK